MKTIKKLSLLLLCLGVVGGAAACDMSMLSSMMGGASVDSQVESTNGEGVSSEIIDNNTAQDKWNEAIKEDRFNNVTFGYSVVFAGEEKANTGIAYLDGDKAAFSEDGRAPEWMTEGETEALRNVYIRTTLAVLENFKAFAYDVVTDTFVSTEAVMYSVNVMGIDAKITANDIRVWFGADNNITGISCNMKQDFVEGGTAKTLEMQATFTFTNYGTTVIDPDIIGGNPDGGEENKPEGGEEGDKPGDVNPDIEDIPPENENKPEDEIIKEAVTEEGWREAFENTLAASNFTLTVSDYRDYAQGTTDNYTANFDGDTLMLTQGNKTQYYAKEGDAVYCYEESGHAWEKSVYDGEVLFGQETVQNLFGGFKDLYSFFDYQPEPLGYYDAYNITVKNRYGIDETYYRVQIGIKDGYIYHINLGGLVKDEDGATIGEYLTMFAFSNRNTTVVTLPVTDWETQATEEEWTAAMEFAVNTNNVTAYMGYTYDYDDDTLDRSTESWMKLKENATHQWGTGTEQYYAKEDGVDYAYRLTKEGLWEKSEVGVEVTYTNYRMASVIDPLRSLYENCGYDEEKGTYFLEAAEVDAGNGTMTTLRNIEIGFRDGELTYLSFEMDMMNSDGEKTATVKIVIELWDYGTTDFDLPQVV